MKDFGNLIIGLAKLAGVVLTIVAIAAVTYKLGSIIWTTIV